MISDIHVHSNFSSDSVELMENHITKAIEKGMKYIGFSDHQDFDAFLLPPENLNYLLGGNGDGETYVNTIHALRDKYADKITILAGVELGLKPFTAPVAEDFSQRFDFDYVIASVHGFDGYDGGDRRLHEGKTARETIVGYFVTELECMHAFHNYNVWGHLDYIVRHTEGKCDAMNIADYSDLVDLLLKNLIDEEKCIDCNTDLLSRGFHHFHPHTDILKRYRELGGELISFGSDGHNCNAIGRAFDRAAAIAKECGFQYYAVFQNREPIMLPIE